MLDLGAKSIRVVSFSGKEDDYWKWSWTFLAAAKVRKYKDILLGKETVPAQDKVIDMMKDGGKKALGQTVEVERERGWKPEVKGGRLEIKSEGLEGVGHPPSQQCERAFR